MGDARDPRAAASGQSSVSTAGVLAVLQDERSRAILGAVRATPRTAPELADELDIPASTVYRKIDALLEAGLVTESHRLIEGGNHSMQYHCPLEGFVVHIRDDGSFETEPVASDAAATSGDDSRQDGRSRGSDPTENPPRADD